MRRAVSRFACHSDLYEMDLLLDVNVEIYPLKVNTLIAHWGLGPFR